MQLLSLSSLLCLRHWASRILHSHFPSFYFPGYSFSVLCIGPPFTFSFLILESCSTQFLVLLFSASTILPLLILTVHVALHSIYVVMIPNFTLLAQLYHLMSGAYIPIANLISSLGFLIYILDTTVQNLSPGRPPIQKPLTSITLHVSVYDNSTIPTAQTKKLSNILFLLFYFISYI